MFDDLPLSAVIRSDDHIGYCKLSDYTEFQNIINNLQK